jgi:hypothetical protein
VGVRTEYSLASLKERIRYARNKVLQIPVEQIAEEDGVTVQRVEQSIRNVEKINALFNVEALEQSNIKIHLFTEARQMLAIADALQAERPIMAGPTASPDTPAIVGWEPEHDVRLRAFEALTERSKAVVARHVKGTTFNNSTSFGLQMNVSAGVTTFEDRLRKIRESMNQPSLPVQNDRLPAGDVVDIVPEKVVPASDGNPPA